MRVMNDTPDSPNNCLQKDGGSLWPTWVTTYVATEHRPLKPPTASTAPPFMTLQEAAGALRVSSRTVRRMIKSGSLTAIRLGRNLRFDRETLCREINDLGSRRE